MAKVECRGCGKSQNIDTEFWKNALEESKKHNFGEFSIEGFHTGLTCKICGTRTGYYWSSEKPDELERLEDDHEYYDWVESEDERIEDE